MANLYSVTALDNPSWSIGIGLGDRGELALSSRATLRICDSYLRSFCPELLLRPPQPRGQYVLGDDRSRALATARPLREGTFAYRTPRRIADARVQREFCLQLIEADSFQRDS